MAENNKENKDMQTEENKDLRDNQATKTTENIETNEASKVEDTNDTTAPQRTMTEAIVEPLASSELGNTADTLAGNDTLKDTAQEPYDNSAENPENLIAKINYSMSKEHISEIVKLIKGKGIKIYYLVQGIFFTAVFIFNMYLLIAGSGRQALSIVLCIISVIFGTMSFMRNRMDVNAFTKKYIDGKNIELSVYKNKIIVHHEETQPWDFDLDSSVTYSEGLICLLLTKGQTTLFVPLDGVEEDKKLEIKNTVHINCNKK